MPRRKIVALVISLLILPIICFSLILHMYRYERNKYMEALQPGMTKEEVIQQLGAPDSKLHPGDALAAWGSIPPRNVTEETWVYYAIPKSQHRFVLIFREGKLEQIDYAAN